MTAQKKFSGPFVIVALDEMSLSEVLAFVDQLSPKLCRLKVGKELFIRYGHEIIEKLQKKGFSIFLDLKLHDIPNQVANACRAVAELGVWMTTIHALGGKRMMEAAAKAIQASTHKPLLLAITVLTSMEQNDLSAVGIAKSLEETVFSLAELAQDSGLDGVVCSAYEAEFLRAKCGSQFCLVTPGIRLEPQSNNDDQRRIMTPVQAKQSGSNYLVIGRPITKSANPLKTLEKINHDLNS